MTVLETPVVRTDRLDELVAHLSGASGAASSAALHSAIEATGASDDRLEVVAHALVTLRRARRAQG
jgi:hypothetical protein